VRLPRGASWLAAGLICAALAVAIVAGAKERSGAALSAGASRLTSFESNRYAYWRVAFRAFSDEPIRGVGAGGWAVYWLRDRPFAEAAQDAHSLPLQTLAELGLIGVAFLATFVGGVAVESRRALRSSPVLAAGPAAALVVYAVHAPLDWDWQMPAVTLVAIVLAGLTIALAEDGDSGAPRLAPIARPTTAP
jgi:O-antigen ligase